MPSVKGTEKPKKDVTFNAHYCEMQVVGETPETEREWLWFQCDGGQWVGISIPPGKTFSTDGDFPEAGDAR